MSHSVWKRQWSIVPKTHKGQGAQTVPFDLIFNLRTATVNFVLMAEWGKSINLLFTTSKSCSVIPWSFGNERLFNKETCEFWGVITLASSYQRRLLSDNSQMSSDFFVNSNTCHKKMALCLYCYQTIS